MVKEFKAKKDKVLHARRKKFFHKVPQTQTERRKINELAGTEWIDALEEITLDWPEDLEPEPEPVQQFKKFIQDLKEEEHFGTPEEDVTTNMGGKPPDYNNPTPKLRSTRPPLCQPTCSLTSAPPERPGSPAPVLKRSPATRGGVRSRFVEKRRSKCCWWA
jgi:hypothetical protein